MADNNMNKTPEDMTKNENMQREQGQQGQGFDKNRQPEKGSADKERDEKSAIGGGQSGQSPTGQQSGQGSMSQSGESPKGEQKELDKNRSEPTSR